MKNLRCLFLFAIVFAMVGCSHDEKFKDSSLTQTQWKGRLQFKEDNLPKECNINIVFESESTGNYYSDDLDKTSHYLNKTTLDYKTDNKILTIGGGVKNLLLGDWWIIKYTQHDLILKREGNTDNEAQLILTK